MIIVTVHNAENRDLLDTLVEFVRTHTNLTTVRVSCDRAEGVLNERPYFNNYLVIKGGHIRNTGDEDIKPEGCNPDASTIVNSDVVYILADDVAVIHEYGAGINPNFCISVRSDIYKETNLELLQALLELGMEPVDAILVMVKAMYAGAVEWK